MAEAFTNARLSLTDSLQPAYSPPPGVAYSVVLMCQVANVFEVDGEGEDVHVDVVWSNPGSPTEFTHLVKNLYLPKYSSISVIEGKFLLTPGQELLARCSEDDGAELTVVVLEITT